MIPISAPCDRTYYKASRRSGTRDLADILWLVLHGEEASTAKSAAAWFHNPRKPEDNGPAGSAHLCVDETICYRCLANEDIPWGAPGANALGFHIEQAGFARWSTVIWKRHVNTIRRAAYKSAVLAKQIEQASGEPFPIVFLKAPDLLAHKRGITLHRECTAAFGGTHTCPGPNYPTPMFMWFCRRYRKELG